MDEKILSGYCRCLDQHRIVTAEQDQGQWYADCDYGSCPHEGSCPIAAALRELFAAAK